LPFPLKSFFERPFPPVLPAFDGCFNGLSIDSFFYPNSGRVSVTPPSRPEASPSTDKSIFRRFVRIAANLKLAFFTISIALHPAWFLPFSAHCVLVFRCYPTPDPWFFRGTAILVRAFCLTALLQARPNLVFRLDSNPRELDKSLDDPQRVPLPPNPCFYPMTVPRSIPRHLSSWRLPSPGFCRPWDLIEKIRKP